MSFQFKIDECSLGKFLLVVGPRGVSSILLGDNERDLIAEARSIFPILFEASLSTEFEQLRSQVAGIIEAPAAPLTFPIDLRGTEFQIQVWKATLTVPSGKTASYAEIATQIGSPKSMRAVAQACGQNIIAVAVPCHRVIREDGTMAGYRWGETRKRELLRRERAF